MNIVETLKKLLGESGFAGFFQNGGWQNALMIVIACCLLYLGIKKKFEPLLLVGIAFGCLLVNVSYFMGLTEADALYHPELWSEFLDANSQYYHSYGHIMAHGGFLDILYIGVKTGLYPSLIFMGVGATATRRSSARPKSACAAIRSLPCARPVKRLRSAPWI